MKITISGRIGAGKSTVAKELAEALGYEYYSTGSIMRKIAKEKGINLLKLSEEAEFNPEIDEQIDKFQKEIGKIKDDFVMDSRLGFIFIPDSIKIYLNVDLETSAERLLSRNDKEEHYKDFDTTLDSITERERIENERFMKLYHVDFTNLTNYDLIITTSDLTPNQIVSTIISFLRKMHLLTDKENEHLEEYFSKISNKEESTETKQEPNKNTKSKIK
ncbi:MAG: AAA family ATPase [Nitrospiraceae bacterium]|nr:AAA family ATPase [Nitrospiraceae bacterium]